MKNNFSWIILFVFICSSPVFVFAMNAETLLKYQGLCETNPNPHHIWNSNTNQCECEKPYRQDDMESWACITQTEWDRKHTWNEPSAQTTVTPVTPVAKVDLKKNVDYSIEIDNYSSLNNDGEVSINSGSKSLQAIKAGADEAIYLKALKAWEQQVAAAEQSGSFKNVSNKDEFFKKAEEEKVIKAQILDAEKLIGFNHLRVLESTNKDFKFEFQSKEYKAYWKQSVDNNAFDDTTRATAFNAAASNASGYTSQIRDLKQQLQNSYPTGWKAQYLKVPAKPVKKQAVESQF